MAPHCGLIASYRQSLKRRSQLVTKHLTSSVGGYLPNTITEMWEPARDFAWLKLPTSGARCIVALSSTMPQVMVVSSEGHFYSYNIDLENGGECSLMKQYRYVAFVRSRAPLTASHPTACSTQMRPQVQPTRKSLRAL